jgi:hypothetical protein
MKKTIIFGIAEFLEDNTAVFQRVDKIVTIPAEEVDNVEEMWWDGVNDSDTYVIVEDYEGNITYA